MLGMIAIIVQNNEIKNTCQIIQEVKPGEKYLVRFLNPPAFNRVCNTEEIQQWLLFATQKEADTWVKSSAGPVPEAAARPNGSGGDTPPNDPDPNAGKGDETETPAVPEIIPAKPVPGQALTEAALKKGLEPDISGGQDPEDHGKKS